MDFSKIFIKDANPTKMGGQAVMEGIMMKGADRSAIAVRRADGSINVKEEPLAAEKSVDEMAGSQRRFGVCGFSGDRDKDSHVLRRGGGRGYRGRGQ